MKIRELLGGGYIWTMRNKMPDGSTRTIRVTGRDFEEFARNAFMAGVAFGQENPGLRIGKLR